MKVGQDQWPSDWKPIPLGAMCDIQIGKTPDRNRPEYWGGNHTWLTIADMNDKIVIESKEHVTDKAIADRQVRLVKAGTLLMSFKLTIGKLAFAGKDLYTNEAIAALSIKSEYRDLILPDFLYRALQAVPIAEEADLAVKGFTLNKQKLARIQIPLPYPDDPARSLETQRRIVARLDALLAEVAAARRLHAEIAEDTARVMEAVRDEMFSELASRAPKVQLSSIADTRLGKMLSQSSKSGVHSKPYLRNANVLWDEFNLDDVYKMDILPEERETFLLKPGDLLICEGGEIGRCAVWEGQIEECYFQKALHRARLKDKQSSPRYLMHFVTWATERGSIAKLRTGSAIPHLTGVKLKTLEIIWPKPEVQRQVVAALDRVKEELVQIRKSHTRNLALLDQVEQTILSHAFRGEL